MKQYKQLTYEKRGQIEGLNHSSFTSMYIAYAIGISQSAIARYPAC